MGLFRKIFGPSFKELAEMELQAIKRRKVLMSKEAHAPKKISKIIEKNENKMFKKMTTQLDKVTFCPPATIGKYKRHRKYIYEKVELINIPTDLYFQSDMISFDTNHLTFNTILDDDNEADTVKVYWINYEVGEIPKNRLRDMIHNCQQRGEPIYSEFSKIETEDETMLLKSANIFIAFYTGPLTAGRDPEEIKASLTGVTKNDSLGFSRQYNYEYAYVGKPLLLLYNKEHETYYAFDKEENELGETSSATTKKLRELDAYSDYNATIEEVTKDENGNLGAKIIIYDY